jgi:hypothetical protein
MKNKHLLFLFLMLFILSGINAQVDTIKTLLITEARLDDARETYVEITNMGSNAVNLSQFELGVIGAWSVPWNPGQGYYFMLPNKELAPGKSFVVAAVYDWNPEQWVKKPDLYNRILNKKEFWTIADVQLHFPEAPFADPTDSVTPYYHVLELWNGRDCIYLRQHLSNGDSVVVDQVNGIFDGTDGTRSNKGAVDVAGVTNATNECTLVRKFSVKQGNLNFDAARGRDLTESEWIPIPRQLGGWEMWRALFWTVGNHGDYHLSSLNSSTMNINWTDSILTVPWGVRNDDDIMDYFDKVPGIAWHYDYNNDPVNGHLDSSFSSVRTGDKLTVYACGNTLEKITFKIIASAPTNDANLVIPKYHPNNRGTFNGVTQPFCTVTKNLTMDTIMDIPYGLRIDTLLLYLEKAPEANWEVVYVDGVTRPDLKTGDILKVTAKSGAVKNYYIKCTRYLPSHDANLSSITWPDIPADYRGLYGWQGDTIPTFDPGVYTYKLKVPYGITQIPSLIAKTRNINAKLEVKRAENINDKVESRTYKFKVTAEDDTTIREYTVILEKEILPENVQPYKADPFISEYVFQEEWGNGFMELANPGSVPLDLSNYMIVGGWFTTPADAIRYGSTPDMNNFHARFRKYIPGLKWETDPTKWLTGAYIAQVDQNVNPIVQPKDVFVMADLQGLWAFSDDPANSNYWKTAWFVGKEVDVVINGNANRNTWADTSIQTWGSAVHGWWGDNFYLFKILNDSVKKGLKPATDPNDFELIDVMGTGDGSRWKIDDHDMDQIETYIRKPNIYKGNPVFKGSFGDGTAGSSEWIMYNRAYFDAQGIGWMNDILFVCLDLGKHYMNPFTGYMSTVNSSVYKVSDGYSMNETIKGVKAKTLVSDFLSKIVKADENQQLSIMSHKNGQILNNTDSITNGDTLIVVSAANIYTTKYIIEVTPKGLSDNATLTSSLYTISTTGSTGTIGGFNYGTTLKTILSNILVPSGAFLNIIDNNGKPVSLKMLNFDTTYVDTKASDKIFFEVISENRENKIIYQLKPTATASDAFVISDVFNVDQDALLISLIPSSTTVQGLVKNLVPCPGATVTIKDNMGNIRTDGYIAKDDVVFVKSSDGNTEKLYYLKMLSDTKNSLAYIRSNVYTVSQTLKQISVPEGTSLESFKANLIPAEGATFKVIDNISGQEKTSGNITANDKVEVTSEDLTKKIRYSIVILVSVENSSLANVVIYPNPTSDVLYITGITSETMIEIYNILGSKVLNMTSSSNITIPMKNMSKGIYLITLKNNNIEKRYKVVLK